MLKTKCSTYVPYCDSHPSGQVSLDKNEFKSWATKQLCLLPAWLTIFKSSLSLLVILPQYLPDQNNLGGKYFKLVETFLIVVVSQNVFSAEIDNPFFYKVFQLAPGGVVVLQRHPALVGYGIPHNLQIPPLCREGRGGGGVRGKLRETKSSIRNFIRKACEEDLPKKTSSILVA